MTAGLLQVLVREAAERTPVAPAVRHADEELTYGELAERSSSVAHALHAAGVARGDRVVLHLPKSVDAVVALYAILEAGAAYVPVEPGSPAPRVADIVEQCRPRCIVTWSGARGKLTPELCRLADVSSIFAVDDAEPFEDLPVRALTMHEASTAMPVSSPEALAAEDDLAYVLFTSGSTGTPKGVMLSHGNALAFVNWAVDRFSLRPDDRLSNHAPFTFDLSVLDLFGAAAAGACVTLVPERLGMFPTRLAELIERERLTVWYSVPSVLTLLTTRGNLGARDLSSLRWILFAGEVFPVKYLRELVRAIPHARYANLYGPTETNVVTCYEVQEVASGRTEPVPIGSACPYAECVVVDEDGKVVTEPGGQGILCVRGRTVTQGYFGRPDETAAAFVPHPLTADGGPLYSTGDAVMLDGDGNLLFLGRHDHMVKTGGHRVELGEIETMLFSHPAVGDAVAVAVPDDVLGSRIRAFVVADGVSEKELKAACALRLPRYMVPERIDFREALPRTATGKVDRTRLLDESIDAPFSVR